MLYRVVDEGPASRVVLAVDDRPNGVTTYRKFYQAREALFGVLRRHLSEAAPEAVAALKAAVRAAHALRKRDIDETQEGTA